ncbi:MAG: OmpA family protein [Bacteroidia bacterium]|nr:OmpA family protein [Bacteroidia bacterium]
MKRYLVLFVLIIGLQQCWSQKIFIDTVFFRFDSHELQEADKILLDSLGSTMLKYPTYFIEVFGHTDSIGSTAYNLELSEKRAREVALYLREKGVALDRISYEGMGTTQPVGSNLSFDGRVKNRRSDISAIYTTEVFEPVVEVDSSELEPEEEVVVIDPATLIDTVNAEYDFFDINPKHTTVIFTPQKTKLVIPPDAFETDQEIISVRMAEMFTRRDMIVANQPTLSKDGPLEAAGMFSFEVRDGRRAAKIKEGVKFDAVVPASRRDRDMAVYSGKARRSRRRSRGSGGLQKPSMPNVSTWTETKNPVKYNGLMNGYVIQVERPGSYSISRPLYYALNSERDDQGVDFNVKFKGKVYDKTFQGMIVGEVVKTYIPLKSKGKKEFEAAKVKFLREETELVLIGIQYDNKGNPMLAKLSFKPDYYLKKFYKKKSNRKKRPTIKIKTKFRKVELERLEEILTQLNV